MRSPLPVKRVVNRPTSKREEAGYIIWNPESKRLGLFPTRWNGEGYVFKLREASTPAQILELVAFVHYVAPELALRFFHAVSEIVLMYFGVQLDELNDGRRGLRLNWKNGKVERVG